MFLKKIKRTGSRDEAVFLGEAVEEIEAVEISCIQLIVQRMAQVVLDDCRREARVFRLFGSEADEVGTARLIGAAQHGAHLRRGRLFAHRPERKDERMSREGAPLRREIKDDVAIEPRL